MRELLVVAGGVAANRAVRAALAAAAERRGVPMVAPPIRLCTDNAVMVAWAGLERLRLGWTDDLGHSPAAALAAARAGGSRVNYRHAFHAGNAADCMKHALLVWLLDALLRKPAPFFVLDTHAGVGRYDLLAGPAERTGEWRDGIARLLHEPPRAAGPLCRPGRGADGMPSGPDLPRLARPRSAPSCAPTTGWPAASCTRRTHAALQRLFRRDRQVGVHHRDGWEALRALLPPKETRGLVLIDPPYEAPGEFDRVVAGLRDGAARFNHGVYAAWYPIKHRSPVTTFHEAIRLSGLRDVVAAELWLRAPTDPQRLNGCGLLVRNPPFGFEAAAGPILAALLERLGQGEPGAGTQILRLADE